MGIPKMAESVQTLISKLANLSLSEKEDVLTWLKGQVLLAQSTKPKLSKQTNLPSELYEAISIEAKQQLNMVLPPYSVCKRTKGKGFDQAVETVKTNMENWFPKIDQLQRLSFIGLAAKLIVTRIKSGATTGIPFWNLLISQTHNLPFLIEESFPGYLSSGLLIRVLNQRTGVLHARHQPTSQTRTSA